MIVELHVIYSLGNLNAYEHSLGLGLLPWPISHSLGKAQIASQRPLYENA